MSKHCYKIGSILFLLVSTFNCAEKENNLSSKPNSSKGKEIKVEQDKREVVGVDSYQELKGSGFVVKNYIQLKAAAKACLGGYVGTVDDSMFAAARCPGQEAIPADFAETGKIAILGKDKCTFRKSNIYDSLKDQLWAPELAGRTETLTNEITSSYLQALAVGADVYAHTVEDPMSLCNDKEKSLELASNCLPQYSESQLKSVAKDLQESCEKGPMEARQAIATIMGSAAFAAAALPVNAQKED